MHISRLRAQEIEYRRESPDKTTRQKSEKQRQASCKNKKHFPGEKPENTGCTNEALGAHATELLKPRVNASLAWLLNAWP